MALGNGFPVAQGGGGGRRISSGSGGFSGRRSSGEGGSPIQRRTASTGSAGDVASSDPNYREQKISIPSDMVGCIIGRGGSKINEIRRLSGSKISIAKTAHDDTGERMFVIAGTSDCNEKALFLLYNQLESEKERRVQSVVEEEDAGDA